MLVLTTNPKESIVLTFRGKVLAVIKPDTAGTKLAFDLNPEIQVKREKNK